MRLIDLTEVKRMAKASLGRINTIYIHWTASGYDDNFSDYHINVNGDGGMWTDCYSFNEKKPHTYKRNSGAIGISACCCADAVIYEDGSFDFGTYPPTPEQIEQIAKVVAVLCEELGLKIDIYHVMTHDEAGNNDDGRYPCDPYGTDMIGTGDFDKWDFYLLQDYDGSWKTGGKIFRGKALWYQQHPDSI